MEKRLNNNRTINHILHALVFLTICSIFAFSNITILVMIMQFIFVCIMFLKVIYEKKITISVHFFWMSLFIGWGLIVSLFAYDVEASVMTILNLILKFAFYTSLILFISNERKIDFIMKSIVFSGLILCLRVFIYTPSNVWGTERLGDAFGLNPNFLGIVMAYASISAVYLARKFDAKYYYLFIIPFIFIGLLTGSRKAFLMIAAGVSLLLILSIQKRRNLLFAMIIVTFFAWGLYEAVMNIPILYDVIGMRLETLSLTSNQNVDASTRTRLAMIEESLLLFAQHPILGIGFENFRILSSFGTYSHNNYMELLTSTGILGVIIYYSLPIAILVSSLLKWKNHSKKYSIIVVLLTIVLVMDYGMVTYSQLITHTMLIISFSYYFILKDLNKKVLNKK